MPADLPGVRTLLKDLTAVIDDREGLDIDAAVRNCRDLLNHASSYSLVADRQGSVAGFIHFTVRQTIVHRGPSGLIDELIVAGEHRGRGVGRELVMAAVSECRRIGCCEVEVSTERTNTEAAEFYRRCGFVERGTVFEADL